MSFMNSSQIHLALTHVPVILSLIGLTILIISLTRKNDTLSKTSFFIFLAAGLIALPVYFTGEGAEEIVEDLPGVSEGIIGRHEQFANISFTIILICAAMSLAAILFYKYLATAKVLKYVVLVFAFASAITMAKTAHLGGQIRHTEIQSALTTTGSGDKENNNGNNSQEKTSEQNGNKDDD